MIEFVQYLTGTRAPHRAALETLLAVECGVLGYAPDDVLWRTDVLLDLERVGLTAWDPRRGECITDTGRSLVVGLARVDAETEYAVRATTTGYVGKHRKHVATAQLQSAAPEDCEECGLANHVVTVQLYPRPDESRADARTELQRVCHHCAFGSPGHPELGLLARLRNEQAEGDDRDIEFELLRDGRWV
ncbi:hypothetical protein DMP23_46690 [Amycolatopsis sp. A1MSW2902]|uniref:hypothetical protein n=1 Tax=Amycolatopsis sp. A1MSW2902 TaxID=687413 RepID=UPI00307EF1C5